MDIEQHEKRPTAAIIQDLANVARFQSRGWRLSDFDAFLENLSLWSTSTEPVSAFFSEPIAGVQQHLADTRSQLTGAFGDGLRAWSAAIAEAYRTKGYHVLLVDGEKTQFLLAKPGPGVRIVFSPASLS